MSSDDAVFVLEYNQVYRVLGASMPMIENAEYEFDHGLVTEKGKWNNIVRSFRKAPAFTDKTRALVYADSLNEKFRTEYGVILVEVPKSYFK